MEQCISFPARGRDTSGIFSLQAKGYGQQHPRKQQEAGIGCKALHWPEQMISCEKIPVIHSEPAWLAQGHNKNGTILNGDTSAIEGTLKGSGINSTTSSPKPPTDSCAVTLEQGTYCQPFLYINTPTAGHQELSLGTNLLWEALLGWSDMLLPLLERRCCPCLYPTASFMSLVNMKQNPSAQQHHTQMRLALKCLVSVTSTKENTQKLSVLSAKTHEICGAEHPATTDKETIFMYIAGYVSR